MEQQSSHFVKSPAVTRFKVSFDKEDVEDIIAYNDITNYLSREVNEEDGEFWKFRQVIAHQGPLTHRHPDYIGSKYNVMVEWENGEKSYEPLEKASKENPVVIALYAKDNKLLDTESWKQCKPIAKRGKKLVRLLNQARLRSFRVSDKYQYGFQVPKNYGEACTFAYICSAQ